VVRDKIAALKQQHKGAMAGMQAGGGGVSRSGGGGASPPKVRELGHVPHLDGLAKSGQRIVLASSKGLSPFFVHPSVRSG
jgi:hypothetical protein